MTKRTIVLLSGLATLTFPFLSSILRHFGLDFDTQQQDGFSLYIAIVRAIFQGISPATLMLVFGACTGLLFWATRPRCRDQFFDVGFVRANDRLRKTIKQKNIDPDGAGDDLMDLLKAHPEFQPAWLVYAQWHYEYDDYTTALDGYQSALALGTLKPHDFLRASLSASKLRRHKMALSILQRAEATLAATELSGVILFNMACYHARLGHLDEVVPYLGRAIKAGYRKQASFLKDSDLDPVRRREDFNSLLRTLT